MDNALKTVLVVFKRIMERNFQMNNVSDMEICQNIAYIMMKMGVACGDYCFVWHRYGVFSQLLQTEMHGVIDVEKLSEVILTERAKQKISKLKPYLINTQGSYSLTRWIDTIGSILFIKLEIHPVFERDEILDALLKLKPYLKDENETNQKAWNVAMEIIM